MNFIKKIVDKKIDELVHAQFQKFSRGIFKDRAVLKVKKSKGKYTINSSSEFANELVFIMAQKLGNKKTLVSGAVVSTSNLKEKIDFKEIKQFQGVKRYLIEKEMSGDELVKLILEFPKTFFGLSFQIDEENSLKVKPKAPKSGKPGKGDEEPKADFCKLITNDSELGKSGIIYPSWIIALIISLIISILNYILFAKGFKLPASGFLVSSLVFIITFFMTITFL